jgi:ribose transport system substrate-binding protein
MRLVPTKRLRVALAALVCAAALGLSACASSGGTAATSSDGISGAKLAAVKATVAKAEKFPTTASPTPPPAFTPKAGAHIFFIACDLSVVGCSTFDAGIVKASKAIGYKLTVCNGGSASAQYQQCFTNAVNAKPDVIISGIPQAFVGQGYAAAKAAGIPVIGLFTSNAPGSTKAEVAYTTCTEQGKLAANVDIAGGNGHPNTLFVTEKDVACDSARGKAFTAEYKKLCPSCQLTELDYDGTTMQQSLPKQLQAALVQHPNVDWIQAVFDGAASIAVTQVQQSGKQSKISVVGLDGNAPNIQLIRDGDVQKYDIALAQEEDGWQAVDAAARVYSGQPVDYNIPVNFLLVSSKNVGQIPSSNVWPGSPNYPAYFAKLWNQS